MIKLPFQTLSFRMLSFRTFTSKEAAEGSKFASKLKLTLIVQTKIHKKFSKIKAHTFIKTSLMCDCENFLDISYSKIFER